MSQARGDVAGGLAMDTDNCSVMAVDSEDRRFVFRSFPLMEKHLQICKHRVKQTVKRSSNLQAESKTDHEEWICTISNISKQIYLSENPEEAAARVNQSALEAVTPSSSSQRRHESLCPAGQSQPPTARTSSSASLGSESTNLASLSLVAPDTPIPFDIISPV